MKKKKILQGDRIEHPDFMREKGIKIDYNFYITNQIMNPVKQVLDLEKDEKETGFLLTEKAEVEGEQDIVVKVKFYGYPGEEE